MDLAIVTKQRSTGGRQARNREAMSIQPKAEPNLMYGAGVRARFVQLLVFVGSNVDFNPISRLLRRREKIYWNRIDPIEYGHGIVDHFPEKTQMKTAADNGNCLDRHGFSINLWSPSGSSPRFAVNLFHAGQIDNDEDRRLASTKRALFGEKTMNVGGRYITHHRPKKDIGRFGRSE